MAAPPWGARSSSVTQGATCTFGPGGPCTSCQLEPFTASMYRSRTQAWECGMYRSCTGKDPEQCGEEPREAWRRPMKVGKRGRGMQANWLLYLIWANKPLQPDFNDTEDRQTDVGKTERRRGRAGARFVSNRVAFGQAAAEAGKQRESRQNHIEYHTRQCDLMHMKLYMKSYT